MYGRCVRFKKWLWRGNREQTPAPRWRTIYVFAEHPEMSPEMGIIGEPFLTNCFVGS